MRPNPDYALDDVEAIRALVRENPWASIVSFVPGKGLIASHYPITLSMTTLETVREQLPAMLRGIAEANGCTLESEFVASYPVTYNDPSETAIVLDVLDDLVGADRVTRLEAQSMASEDFAYVLEEVPGTLVFLGAAPDSGSGPLHSERAEFDDSVLGLQASVLAELAWRRLERA